MDRVFFTNSGAEAVEGAIKAARKYAYLKDGRTDHEIIAMEHSFHGRTMGALSVTGNPKYREAFQPMIGNIRFARMNDFDSVLANVTDKTCAILFETVQSRHYFVFHPLSLILHPLNSISPAIYLRSAGHAHRRAPCPTCPSSGNTAPMMTLPPASSVSHSQRATASTTHRQR